MTGPDVMIGLSFVVFLAAVVGFLWVTVTYPVPMLLAVCSTAVVLVLVGVALSILHAIYW